MPRSILLVCAILSSASGWAAVPKNISTCQVYLLAPKGLKGVTAALLRPKTSDQEHVQQRRNLERFVSESAAGSEQLVTYLLELDSSEMDDQDIYPLIDGLLVRYLMRPGSEQIAVKNLSQILEKVWLEFIYGDRAFGVDESGLETYRAAKGGVSSEDMLRFVVQLSRLNPEAVKKSWNQAFSTYMSEMLHLDAVQTSLDKAVDYLKMRSTQSAAERAEDDEIYNSGESSDPIFAHRERLRYLMELLRELDHQPPAQDLDALETLYVLTPTTFSKNSVYEADSKTWGAQEGRLRPVQVFVFLYRLHQRLKPGLPLPHFKEIESKLKEIRRLGARVT